MGLPIKYPEEMRIKIAKAVVEEGRTANQLSKEFPAPLYMIKRWAKLYRYKGQTHFESAGELIQESLNSSD